MASQMNPFAKSVTSKEAILASIRAHLSASIPFDDAAAQLNATKAGIHGVSVADPEDSDREADLALRSGASLDERIQRFIQNLEGVGGHCILVRNETEITAALKSVIAELRQRNQPAGRVAVSDSEEIRNFISPIESEFDEVLTTPALSELFHCDIGFTGAQYGIAETGTLVLDSASERHRIVSLVPPVHVAIVRADTIMSTLGEALHHVRMGYNDCSELSSVITFVTGPSRTADIELTLAIGVHGPKELFVIITDMKADQ
jgi:L-lactate dehydrogenase complex protein LldG